MVFTGQGRLPNTHVLASLLVTAGILSAAGCHHGPLYPANSLPPEFMAPRVSSMQQVDLSRLARSVGNSELLYPGDVVDVSIATGLEGEDPPHWKLRLAENGTVFEAAERQRACSWPLKSWCQ